ncbi:hypothetical protein Rsub_00214 [Raphidocelis subcapitata]|uniref:Uncharacterized protein n=1 Tax=Raphidocelis subcapitata TaxID=307507 RepID=A0A2V0NPS0_9CHLO|nr:hypothetical protein Rsub_00214 [Raphidocelis subcapitata]|eukprot:GBF87503.1 hypothetical protein Rsub_00214 [Raphidocelis subcapitata]
MAPPLGRRSRSGAAPARRGSPRARAASGVPSSGGDAPGGWDPRGLQPQQQQPGGAAAQPQQPRGPPLTEEQLQRLGSRTWLTMLWDALPSWLVTGLATAARFVASCPEVLPQFVSPSLPEALRRAGLVLAVSLVAVVVVSSIDSAWLLLYLLRAKRGVPLPA